MKTFRYSRAVMAALIGVAMSGSITIAHADIKDYAFQLVDQTIKAGPDKTITVRLLNMKTGKPVPAGESGRRTSYGEEGHDRGEFVLA